MTTQLIATRQSAASVVRAPRRTAPVQTREHLLPPGAITLIVLVMIVTAIALAHA
jgi:hypothetical protein